MFIDYIGTMRGWGRGLRKAVGNWYTQRPITDAVYQAVKYRSRYNWTHRDLLRKAHPNAIDPQMDALFAWITKGTLPLWDEHPDLRLILAYEDAKTAGPNDLARMIELRQLTWEMVPSEMLDKEVVWRALGRAMPMTALLRNLATLTRVGVIAPMDSAWVCEILKKIGTMNLIHPIAVLTDSETWAGNIHPVEALRQYRRKSGIPAKLVVVGMVSNGFSIADPDDAGMMDVVGFDSAVPELITDFAMSGGAVTVLPWGEVEKKLPMVHSDGVEPEDVPAENVGYTNDF